MPSDIRSFFGGQLSQGSPNAKPTKKEVSCVPEGSTFWIIDLSYFILALIVVADFDSTMKEPSAARKKRTTAMLPPTLIPNLMTSQAAERW